MLSFSLSKRQFADLSRGLALQIAIPEPVAVPADLVAWYRDSLSLGAQYHVTDCRPSRVWCHAFNRGGVPGSPASTWGEIIDRDRITRPPVVALSVIVATVSMDTCQTKARLIRWPGGIVKNSEKFIGDDSTTTDDAPTGG